MLCLLGYKVLIKLFFSDHSNKKPGCRSRYPVVHSQKIILLHDFVFPSFQNGGIPSFYME
jgi:hypothetical protein